MKAKFLLAFLVSATVVQAQSSDENSSIERITTTSSRFASVANDYDGSIGWLDQQAIGLVSPQHVQQVSNRIAGVNLQRGNGQEYLPAIRSPVFTGAGACGELLTTEDNIPLRAAGFCNVNELFEAGTEYASAIEVLKGPGTVIYGSNAIHGVVNVVTQDPIENDERIGLEWGSFGYARLKFSTGNNQSQHGVGVNASVTDDSGYRDDEGYKQQKLHARYRNALGGVNIESGISFSNLDQNTAGYIVGLDAYKDAELAQSNSNPEAFRKARSVRVWTKLSGDTALSSYEAKWQLTPYVRWQDMQFKMHFLPGQPLEENDQRSLGLQSSLQFDVDDTMQWLMGVDGEITSASLLQFQENPTEGSSFLQATIPAGKQYDYQVDAQMLAAFVQMSWQFATDWQLNVGMRAEHINYDYDNLMVSGRVDENGNGCGFGGCRYTRPDDRSDDYFTRSPRVSLQYVIDPNHSIYTTLSQGYRAPQATELYRLQRAQTVAELDSVDAINIETGYRLFMPTWHVQVAVYAMNKDNVIIRDTEFFNRSNGETKHRGIELTGSANLSEQWQLNSAIAYSKHTYANDVGGTALAGNMMDTAPRWLSSTQITWIPRDDVRAELSWEYTSDYYLAPENREQYNGHHLFHLRAVWQVTPKLTVKAQLNNVFDRAYAERGDYTSFSGPRYFPGEPRNAQVGVQYYF
ncbi:TonB-dependent receptor [Alteromonas facilis]|uniref:TonB-dependent receptor n=1 Tax=Alteromonas facilis TaxID=2048004 RepID=UPI000C2956CE|nr:TonB-dependent receptor [Alteromonas facilis]